MSLPSNYARVFAGELGRTIAEVHEDGMIVDRITGYTKADCLDTLRVQYPRLPLFDYKGNKIRRREILDLWKMESPNAGSTTQLDRAVNDILMEVAVDRKMGRLKPFIEGEPIGVIPPQHRRKQ